MHRDEVRSRPRNYLREWREFRELTQMQLAAMVGTKGSVISLLESGDRRLSDKWLRRLAPALNTTHDLLLEFAPEDADLAMMNMFARLSPESRPAMLEKLSRYTESPQVVTFPKKKTTTRKDSGPISKSNKSR